MRAESLRQVLDATSAVVAVKDLRGRYVYVNHAFLALLGGAAADYLGRSDDEIFSPAMAARLRANDRRVLEERREQVFEEVLELPAGRRVYSTRKYPLLDADGTPWAVGLTAEDVTEARRREDALRRVALGISAASGPEVFELTVSSAADVLGADLAFVAQLEDACEEPELATLAVCEHGRPGQDIRYALRGTPCARVMAQGFEYYSGTAASLFSGDPMLGPAGYVSYAGYPLIDSHGRPAGVLSICHTGPLPPAALVESILAIFAVRAASELDRARMDRALRDSEASYRAIFEATEDCIFIHDIDTGAFVDANPRACEVYGYDRAALLSLSPGDLSTGEPPYTQAEAEQFLRRARAGEIVRFEWHRRNRDGSAAWDEVCLKRVRLAGVDRILAVTRDITERMEREQALARSEDRLRATVSAALDCIIVMDSGGRIREFNPAAEDAFGYRRQETLGRPLAELIVPPRLRRAHQAGLERFLRSGERRMLGRRVELSAMHADGREFPVELAIAEAEGVDGRVFIGYLRDITEQKAAEQARVQLESQLRQAQKMEAIGHLAGGVAHDFNNILAGVMGYLGMAEELVRQDDERLLRYLERARHAGTRAADLIQQMLTFSRGQRGSPRPLAPEPVLRNALNLVRAALPATTLLDVELEPDLPTVMADPVQLEQVLMNLCINARDAMDAQGTLAVRLRHAGAMTGFCTACHQPFAGPHVELEVSDSGPGIPPEVMARVFEPFFTTKAPGQGSGMGLATVHGIVHEHHGHILVDSRAGEGTSFRVLLPALAREAEPQSPPGVDARHARNDGGVLQGRLLLVEDDPQVRDFLAELLADWGLEVDAFAEPRAALEALHGRTPYDAALLDYTMPHMTGLQLARALRAHQPALPVILCSGLAAGLDTTELGAAGVMALLGKPVDTAALFGLLEQALTPG
jgi:PAS domain S-box-containing protein